MTNERNERREEQSEGVFAAWASRVEAGEELDFEELVRVHAALEPELRALHDDWKHFAPILGNVVPGLIASGDGLVLPSLTRGPDVDEGPPSEELLEKLGLHAPDTKRYRFRGRIGTGGQGVVLKVWDAKLSRPLAMKIVLGRAEDQPTGQTPRVDGRRLTRFVDEARIASQLNHPGIVPVHELGADESGRAFFTMKLVKGDDLARIFDKVKRGEDGIGLPRVVSYLLRVCEAMAYAHDRGVIHRDLKPANVMVGAYGEVHVMDWGLARVIGDAASDASAPRALPTAPISQVDSVRRADRETTPGSVLATEHGDWIGTPCYMSPEQARGDNAAVGPQSDVYAVGAMLYQLLTGTPPYVPPGERVSGLIVLRQTIHGPPPPVESLAPRAIPELVAIGERAMARDPAARYASMRALAADLQAFLENRVVSAFETGVWAETRKWVKRNRALAAAIGSVVVALLGGIFGMSVLAEKASEKAHEADVARRETEVKNSELVAANALIEKRSQELMTKNVELDLARQEAEVKNDALVAANHMIQERSRELEAKQVEVELAQQYANRKNAELVAADTVIAANSKEIAARDAEVVARRLREELTLYRASIRNSDAALNAGNYQLFWEALSSAPERHRNWEWRYLRARADCRFILPHTKEVVFVEFSANGDRVLTRTLDGSVRLWSADLGTDVAHLNCNSEVANCASFSRDGGRVVTGCSNGMAYIWDATTGAELAKFEGHTGPIESASFNPHGGLIVTASADRTARIWDTNSRGSVATLKGHAGPLRFVSFSPDGALVLTASEDWTARIWNTNSGDNVATLRGHSGSVSYALFTPDGTGVLTASHVDRTVRMWNTKDNENPAQYTLSTPSLHSAAFSPDGTRIVVASHDPLVRVYDARTGKPVLAFRADQVGVTSASFSPDGSQILTSGLDKTVGTWNSSNGNRLGEPRRPIAGLSSVFFNNDGTLIAAASRNGSTIIINAEARRQQLELTGHTDRVSSAAFNTYGTRAVTGSRDATVRLWDTNTGKELAKLKEDLSVSTSMDISPDGSLLVSGSAHGGIRFLDTIAGEVTKKLWPHADVVLAVQFSPDGSRVVTASRDSKALILDVGSGVVTNNLEGHTDAVLSARFSPDGLRIVTASRDRSVLVWSASTGEKIAAIDGHGQAVNSAAFSPDGAYIVTASDDGYSCVWDADSYSKLLLLDGHTGAVNSAFFSPDGTRIITASNDMSAIIWDASNGLKLLSLKGHSAAVTFATFSADGTRIITTSEDKTSRIWDSVTHIERLREREALVGAKPAAEEAVTAALNGGTRFSAAAAQIASDSRLDPLVRQVALEILSERAQTSLGGLRSGTPDATSNTKGRK